MESFLEESMWQPILNVDHGRQAFSIRFLHGALPFSAETLVGPKEGLGLPCMGCSATWHLSDT